MKHLVSRFRLLCAASLVAASPVAAASPPAPRPADRTAIQAAYEGLSASFSRHDLPRFMSYFTEDYTDIDEKGAHLTRAC